MLSHAIVKVNTSAVYEIGLFTEEKDGKIGVLAMLL